MSRYKFGIVCAMKEETSEIVKAFKLQKLSTSYNFDLYTNSNIILINCGIGKTASASATTHIINVYDPTTIINIGLCGGINKNLKIGDTFLVDDVYQADAYKPFEGYEYFTSHIKIPNHNCNVDTVPASLATVDRFVDRIDDTLGFTLDADIVDMEGYSVAYVCEQYNKNYYLIKSICDYCNQDSKTNLYENLAVAMDNGLKLLKQIINED